MKFSPLPILLLAFAFPLRGADTDAATNAINSLGIDLLKKTGKPDENTVFSPYSIQSSLAMIYAGAGGKTREQMRKALYYPDDDTELAQSFAALQKMFNPGDLKGPDEIQQGTNQKITLMMPSRIYAREGYQYRKDFLSWLGQAGRTAPAQMDFEKDPDAAARAINEWVEKETGGKIASLLAPGTLPKDTQLALVSAVYLKARWQFEFEAADTKPAPFYANGVREEKVETMYQSAYLPYAKRKGYSIVRLGYSGSNLQMAILVPDDRHGLAALEAGLMPAMLADSAKLKTGAVVNLWLPKFTLDPPLLALSAVLKSMGVRDAFDGNAGVADFTRMLSDDAGKPPHVSEVFHKAFFSLDEEGTEAAAGNMSYMSGPFGTLEKQTPPPEVNVHVDHPFLFVIQQRDTGACLFIGRVADPR